MSIFFAGGEQAKEISRRREDFENGFLTVRDHIGSRLGWNLGDYVKFADLGVQVAGRHLEEGKRYK